MWNGEKLEDEVLKHNWRKQKTYFAYILIDFMFIM